MILDNCKLTYFGIAGRGEATRLALSIGKVNFSDDRISFAQWKEIKPSTPWGSVPVLTLADGTIIAQQRAILRFVGKETGLYPTDSLEAAKVDELMDAFEDINAKTMAAGSGLEQAEKEAARKAAVSEGGVVHGIVAKIDKRIADNGKDGIIVGDALTIADLFIYTVCNNLVSGLFDGVPSDAIDGFSNLTALRRAVRSHPEVCKWYDGLDSSIQMPTSYGAL